MPLTAAQEQQLAKTAEIVVRLDERTERMDREVDQRFEDVHGRIKDVKADARAAGQKGGGTVGAIVSLVISGAAALLGVTR